MKLPSLMGHRGAAAVAPENTLVGVKAAKDAGVDWVELDVLLTADGVPVIHHDQDMARCFGDPRALSAASADSLPDGLPTLAQMLDQLSRLDMGLNLELKTYEDSDIEALVKAVAKIWADHQPRGYVSSFSSQALAGAVQHMPTVPRALITTPFDAGRVQEAKRLDCFSINVDYQMVTAPVVTQAVESGLQVGAWTVNSRQDAQNCRLAGVHCVITDDPALLLANADDL